jgi:hypothetical protein
MKKPSNIFFLKVLSICLFMAIGAITAAAQERYRSELRVKERTMYITLSKNLPLDKLASFIKSYSLHDVGLYNLFAKGQLDSVQKSGWTFAEQGSEYTLTKPLGDGTGLKTASDLLVYTTIPTDDNWRVIGDNRTVFGMNRFRDSDFKREAGITYFFLKGHSKARSVRVAGNFTNWQRSAFPMTRTQDGWMAPVQLKPGQYFYKYILNEEDWIVDPENEIVEPDGQGNTNSVYFVPNKIFVLKGYSAAQSVYVSGSFNNWSKRDLPLKRISNGWLAEVYLQPGTHQFHFLVDGQIVNEPEDKGAGGGKGEVILGSGRVFSLPGYENARSVMLAGDFNDWRERDIWMQRTSDGWQVTYALGPGNYQYKFIVDGKWIIDPQNPNVVTGEGGHSNSFLVIAANYTFRLKGFKNARTVNLAGEFSNWSPEGLTMKRVGDEWVYPVYLGRGKHLYKFIVDGKWIRDPANPQWEDGDENSVLWIE